MYVGVLLGLYAAGTAITSLFGSRFLWAAIWAVVAFGCVNVVGSLAEKLGY